MSACFPCKRYHLVSLDAAFGCCILIGASRQNVLDQARFEGGVWGGLGALGSRTLATADWVKLRPTSVDRDCCLHCLPVQARLLGCRGRQERVPSVC